MHPWIKTQKLKLYNYDVDEDSDGDDDTLDVYLYGDAHRPELIESTDGQMNEDSETRDEMRDTEVARNEVYRAEVSITDESGGNNVNTIPVYVSGDESVAEESKEPIAGEREDEPEVPRADHESEPIRREQAELIEQSRSEEPTIEEPPEPLDTESIQRPVPRPRRSERTRKTPQRYTDYQLYSNQPVDRRIQALDTLVHSGILGDVDNEMAYKIIQAVMDK